MNSLSLLRTGLINAGLITVALCLTACGGGSGGGTDDFRPPAAPVSEPAQLAGAGVKGPLVAATVRVYRLDTDAADLKGQLVTQGSSTSQAVFSGVSIPSEIEQTSTFLTTDQFLVEVSGGTVINTNNSPVISRLTTIISGSDYSRDMPVYATPLSTLAIEIAQRREEGTFADNLQKAQALVIGSFGLGILDGVDLFSTPPLVAADADQALTLNYRTAIEVFAALVEGLRQEAVTQGANVSNDELVSLLAQDLLDDNIDGVDSSGALPGLSVIPDLNASISKPVSDLIIPGTDKKISELKAVLSAEAAIIVPSVAVSDLPVPEPHQAIAGVDSDGDLVADLYDLFPFNPREWVDSDGDCGDILMDEQTETSGDGCGDNSDWHFLDPEIKSVCDDNTTSEPAGQGTLLTPQQKEALGCTDSDGDGVNDIEDKFPFNPREWADSDGDCGDISMDEQTETSGDGCGDNSDENICYTVESTSIFVSIVDPSSRADGIGTAQLDSYNRVLTIGYTGPKAEPNSNLQLELGFTLQTAVSINSFILESTQTAWYDIKTASDDVDFTTPDCKQKQEEEEEKGEGDSEWDSKSCFKILSCEGDELSCNGLTTQLGVVQSANAANIDVAVDLSSITLDTSFNLLTDVISTHVLTETSRVPSTESCPRPADD